MFEHRGAFSRTFAGRVGPGFFRKDGRGSVFHKVDATFVALFPVGLYVATSRALERERGVAPRTEASAFWSIGGALRTFHILIVGKRAETRPAEMILGSC